jgi:hypothetical protein
MFTTYRDGVGLERCECCLGTVPHCPCSRPLVVLALWRTPPLDVPHQFAATLQTMSWEVTHVR